MKKNYTVTQNIWSKEHDRYLQVGEVIQMDESDPNSDAQLFKEMGLIVPTETPKKEVTNGEISDHSPRNRK